MQEEAVTKALVSYILVGVINTCVGLGLAFALIYLGVNIYVANALGYALGILVSYALNSIFTFKASYSHKRLGLFCLAMLASYTLNLIALALASHTLSSLFNEVLASMPREARASFLPYGALLPYLSQLIASMVYVISGFVLNRCLVFKDASDKEVVKK